MIIVKLMGGMGNQMFQYAFGLYLSRKNNTPLKLDLNFLLDRSPKKNFVYRDFDLGVFSVSETNLASLKDVAYYSGERSSGFSDLLVRAKRKLSKPLHLLDYSMDFIPSYKELSGNLYLEGYFQSFRYFIDIEPEIRKEFRFADPVLDSSKELMNKIFSCESVCLNVRRADFVDENIGSNVQGFVGTEYYLRALEKLKEKIKTPELFVFSDDVVWCKENLRFDVPVHFVDHSHKGVKFSNYLQLMTLCKHYIIPNSTFAWWAAWLNVSPSKIVVCPKKWFSDDTKDTSDLTPETWIRI